MFAGQVIVGNCVSVTDTAKCAGSRVARAVCYFKDVGCCTHRIGSAGSQTKRLNRGSARAIVCTNRGTVAYDCAAKSGGIRHGDVRRASDRWQLRVRDRYRERASSGVARSVRYFKDVGCCTHRIRSAGSQTKRLNRGSARAIVCTNRRGVAHDGAAKTGVFATAMFAGQVIVGNCVSVTDTANAQVAVLPVPSVTLKMLVVAPTGYEAPEAKPSV
jgi:hypothetical protein